MKRTFLLIFVLGFISYYSHAQINQGRIQVGGSIGGNYQKIDSTLFQPEYKNTSINVSPSIGWFYKTNKLAGLFLNFGYYENDQNFKIISRSYGGGVFFRQYQPVLNKLYIFLNESGDYNYLSGNGNQKTHGYNIGASLQAGMAYDITKKMQLEISLNRLVNAAYQNGGGIKNYNISTSLEKDVFSNIGFGFRYFLK